MLKLHLTLITAISLALSTVVFSQQEGSATQAEGSATKALEKAADGANKVEGSATMAQKSYQGFKGIDHAHCVITPTKGNKVTGIVKFTQKNRKIHIVADVAGLTPNAKHAIHIHEYGDLSSGDGKSTGGHYNPLGHRHAGPDIDERHAGDLGNLAADAAGKAHYEITVDNITIHGRKNPILGRGVIIHAGEDDLKSQPTGAAGARIGQGIIGVGKAPE